LLAGLGEQVISSLLSLQGDTLQNSAFRERFQPSARRIWAVSRANVRIARLVEKQAAVDVVCLAGDEARLLGGQEADHIGNILGLSDAP
jgi:Histidine kinase